MRKMLFLVVAFIGFLASPAAAQEVLNLDRSNGNPGGNGSTDTAGEDAYSDMVVVVDAGSDPTSPTAAYRTVTISIFAGGAGPTIKGSSYTAGGFTTVDIDYSGITTTGVRGLTGGCGAVC